MCAIDDRPADTSGSYRFIAESFGKDVAEGTTYMLEVELPEVQHDPKRNRVAMGAPRRYLAKRRRDVHRVPRDATVSDEALPPRPG